MTSHRFLTNQLKVARILWAALTFSNVLFGVATYLVRLHARPIPEAQPLILLYASAFCAAVASFVVPRMMQAKNLRAVRVEVLPGDSPPVPGRPGGRFANPVQAVRKAIGLAFTSFILAMALSEVTSLMGLTLRTMGGPLTNALALIAVGTLLAASRFPTPARLLAPFERATGATFAASEGGSY